MFGKATLDIPADWNIGHSRTEGLSDQMALSFGRIAAMTLSDNKCVKVTLESGQVKIICNTTTIGRK